jgi:hypothetical protein
MNTNAITKRALLELDLKDYEVWRSNNIAVRGRTFIGRKGVSDIIGFCRKTSSFVLCEVKGDGDRLKPEQVELLDAAKKAGCIVLIATLDDKGKFTLKPYKPTE